MSEIGREQRNLTKYLNGKRLTGQVSSSAPNEANMLERMESAMETVSFASDRGNDERVRAKKRVTKDSDKPGNPTFFAENVKNPAQRRPLRGGRRGI